jgi:hypothetical protein
MFSQRQSARELQEQSPQLRGAGGRSAGRRRSEGSIAGVPGGADRGYVKPARARRPPASLDGSSGGWSRSR